MATHNSYFIIINLEIAIKIKTKTAISCLYLPSKEYQNVIKNINQLSSFKFICFDNNEQNKQLYSFLMNRKNNSASK